jgi:hypothetical protein
MSEYLRLSPRGEYADTARAFVKKLKAAEKPKTQPAR